MNVAVTNVRIQVIRTVSKPRTKFRHLLWLSLWRNTLEFVPSS